MKGMNQARGTGIGFRLDCRSIEQLVSRSMDTRLSFAERWAVRIHLAYCRVCRSYRRQLELLRTALRKAPEHLEEMLRGPGLSEELRRRLERLVVEGGEGTIKREGREPS